MKKVPKKTKANISYSNQYRNGTVNVTVYRFIEDAEFVGGNIVEIYSNNRDETINLWMNSKEDQLELINILKDCVDFDR